MDLALGNFWPIEEEWGDLKPRTMLESGFKAGFSVFRTRVIQIEAQEPGLLFNYAFSTNEPEALIVHYHTLNPRIPLELCLGVGDRWNFWVGGGPEYRVDIIDFETSTLEFVTDIAYAFGVFGSAGIEVFLGS